MIKEYAMFLRIYKLRLCEYKNQIPLHSPTIQVSVLEHSSCCPHLHFPITQASAVIPEHFSVDPQIQTLDRQVSESPVQSESLKHSRTIELWRANKHWV